ncbi:MAG: AmmeMemoRadiSam system radical SAM enzyme [Clostridiales bacterium]|nr:AmmeMemoRadiSam system radical SAM enzyme [Clostridiales bacterium]
MARCEVCFRHCEIAEGKTGYCGARGLSSGKVVPLNYGKITALALDPIEKKPLARFHPGSMILSAGSYGCNLNCPFCQNHDISKPDKGLGVDELTPEELADLAKRLSDRGNIGVAFTYNEPLIGYEFVRDTAKLVHDKGMKNVMVTNGHANIPVAEELLPYIDAMNIDLKCFSDKTYKKILGGDLDQVRAFISRAVTDCHIELTTLVVPGMNDTEEEMRELSSWIASLPSGQDIPLHISRFFPRYKMSDAKATPVADVYRLAKIARDKLSFVYTGNC